MLQVQRLQESCATCAFHPPAWMHPHLPHSPAHSARPACPLQAATAARWASSAMELFASKIAPSMTTTASGARAAPVSAELAGLSWQGRAGQGRAGHSSRGTQDVGMGNARAGRAAGRAGGGCCLLPHPGPPGICCVSTTHRNAAQTAIAQLTCHPCPVLPLYCSLHLRRGLVCQLQV